MRIAAYARYSTDQQSASSIEDQLRNCRQFCARQGWPEPVVYQDAAISGARNDRPGYARLRAESHGFDVIIVDDLSRLSRDSIEIAQALRQLTYSGVRVIGVSDSLDTSRKDAKINAGLRGLMNELYLDELRDKTHRGLTGKALAGANAGGRAYGYRTPSTGVRVIDEREAEVVRRIYADYLAGKSPRTIAADLNREGISSPRGSTWALSAIHGDVRRGIGILANPIYCGKPVWNRARFVKHPVTGRRTRKERDPSEWIHQDAPDLAIVSEATWKAVQARLKGCSVDKPSLGGRRPRYLLSGLLRCGSCGGALVMVDATHYGCAAHRDRGTCLAPMRVRRDAVEEALLSSVRADFLSPAAFERVQKVVAASMKKAGPNLDVLRRRLAEAERARANLMDAILDGIRTPSTKAALLKAEGAVAEIEAEIEQAKKIQPARMIPRLRDEWRAMVGAIGEHSRNIPAARSALQSLLGRVTLKTENGATFCEIAPSQITMVAGAGFGRYLVGEPLRIAVPDRRTVAT